MLGFGEDVSSEHPMSSLLSFAGPTSLMRLQAHRKPRVERACADREAFPRRQPAASSALASHAERDDGLHERCPDAHDVGFTPADNAVE